jgi:hypothetical protein
MEDNEIDELRDTIYKSLGVPERYVKFSNESQQTQAAIDFYIISSLSLLKHNPYVFAVKGFADSYVWLLDETLRVAEDLGTPFEKLERLRGVVDKIKELVVTIKIEMTDIVPVDSIHFQVGVVDGKIKMIPLLEKD